jgi:glycine cleavage system H protein
MKISDYDMPEGLFYSESYAWVQREDDTIRVGVIEFAVKLAGKIEYVDLPQVGDHFEEDDVFGTVESGKWVGEMVMPVSGEITHINQALFDNPATVYDDPFGEGWLIVVRPDTMDDLSLLMSDPQEITAWLEKEIKTAERLT